jgi:G:T-mismatch repair DNA endonuclease (very short patch repair protein)
MCTFNYLMTCYLCLKEISSLRSCNQLLSGTPRILDKILIIFMHGYEVKEKLLDEKIPKTKNLVTTSNIKHAVTKDSNGYQSFQNISYKKVNSCRIFLNKQKAF